MRLVPMAATTLIKIFRKLGFIPARQKGSHLIIQHPDGRSTAIPIHGSKDIGPQLISGILKEAKISREEFFKLLKEILILLGIVARKDEKNAD